MFFGNFEKKTFEEGIFSLTFQFTLGILYVISIGSIVTEFKRF